MPGSVGAQTTDHGAHFRIADASKAAATFARGRVVIAERDLLPGPVELSLLRLQRLEGLDRFLVDEVAVDVDQALLAQRVDDMPRPDLVQQGGHGVGPLAVSGR